MDEMASDIPYATGAELLRVVKKDDPFWERLKGAEITHPLLGDGVITSVKIRRNYYPLFEVTFSSGHKSMFGELLLSSIGDQYRPISLDETVPDHLRPIFRTKQQRVDDETRDIRERRQREQEERDREARRAAAEQARREERHRIEQQREIERHKSLSALRDHFKDLSLFENELDEWDIEQLLELRSISMPPEKEAQLKENEKFLVLAIYFTRQFTRDGGLGLLSKVCGYWRKAGRPEISLQMSDDFKDYNRSVQWCHVWTSRGAAYSDMGRYKDAIECGLEVLEARDSDPYPHNMLGRAYISIGQDEQGLDHFRQALALGSSKRHVHSQLGSVKSSLGEDRRRAFEATITALRSKDDRYAWLDGVPF